MKTILFATSNDRKLGEARLGCQQFNIDVQQIKLHIEEIQSLDPLEISKLKAAAAYSQVNKPVVVTDTFWNIPALNGFPGAYMKDVSRWFTPQDFLNLIADKTDKRVSFTESITYQDASQIKTFTKEFWGIFSEQPRGSGNSIEQVAEFEGFTLGERHDQNSFSHKPKDYIWYAFARWFSEQ